MSITPKIPSYCPFRVTPSLLPTPSRPCNWQPLICSLSLMLCQRPRLRRLKSLLSASAAVALPGSTGVAGFASPSRTRVMRHQEVWTDTQLTFQDSVFRVGDVSASSLCFSQTGDCALFILHIRLWLCWGVFAGIVLWIKRSLFKGQSSFYFSIVQGLLSRTWEWDASSVPWEPELCMEARGSRYKHRQAGSGASIWVFGAEFLLQLPPTPDPGIILEVHCVPSSSRRKYDESTALWTLKQNKTKPRIQETQRGLLRKALLAGVRRKVDKSRFHRGTR